MARERLNPTQFWNNVLVEIDQQVAGARQDFTLLAIAAQDDKVRRALDDRETRAAGIPQKLDPEIETILANVDKATAANEQRLLRSSLSWGARCHTYAEQMLISYSEAHRGNAVSK